MHCTNSNSKLRQTRNPLSATSPPVGRSYRYEPSGIPVDSYGSNKITVLHNSVVAPLNWFGRNVNSTLRLYNDFYYDCLNQTVLDQTSNKTFQTTVLQQQNSTYLGLEQRPPLGNHQRNFTLSLQLVHLILILKTPRRRFAERTLQCHISYLSTPSAHS